MFHGDGDLPAKTFEQQAVIVGDGVHPVALDVEHAEDLVPQFDGDGDLAAGFRQQRVGLPIWVFREVGAHHRFSAGGGHADQALPHRHVVPGGLHLPPGLAVSGNQHDGILGWIVTQQLGVVVPQAFFGQGDHALEQVVQLGGLSDFLRDFGADLHLIAAAFQSFLELFLKRFLLGDIADGDADAGDVAACIFEHRTVNQGVDAAAIFGNAHPFNRGKLLPLHQPHDGFFRLLMGFRRSQGESRFPHDLFFGVSKDAFCRRVPTGDFPARGGSENRVVRDFNDGSQMLQHVFGLLALGDVAPGGVDQRFLPNGHRGEQDLGHEILAVQPTVHPLKAVAALPQGGLDHLLRFLPGRASIGLKFRGEIRRMRGKNLGLVFGAQHLHRGLVAIHKDVPVQNEIRVCRMFKEHLKERFPIAFEGCLWICLRLV